MTDMRSPLEELVVATADDWSDLGWVYSTCMDYDVSEPEEVRALALQTIKAGLERDVLVAGDVTADGFTSWDLPPAAAYARIRDAWHAAPAVVPEPSTIVWFDLTAAGEALAERILEREDA